MKRFILLAACVSLGVFLVGGACAPGAGTDESDSPGASGADAVRVELVSGPEGHVLMRGGSPYFVRGAGGDVQLPLLKQLGGNTIRTWGADQLEPKTWEDGSVSSVLDRAHALGLTVIAGFWMQHSVHGFDYFDPEQVAQQDKALREFIVRYKDHPAILMWGIGNEVTIPGDPSLVFKETNRLARIARELDPDHPTMMVLSGVWPAHGRLFSAHCSDVDVLGVNVYGGLNAIPQELLRQGFDGPYMVTEFGPFGHWEVGTTHWGSPVEQSSTLKAMSFRTKYTTAVLDQPDRCLGARAFYWGQKQERTETWYGMFLKTGEKTESVDAMAEMWTGVAPANRAPQLMRLEASMAMSSVAPGQTCTARAPAVDPEGDALTFAWSIKRESTDHKPGGEPEVDPGAVEVAFSISGDRVEFAAPQEAGGYRLFVIIRDGNGSAATANVPFLVRPG